MTVKVVPIGADQAEEIFELACQFHPESLHLSVDDIAESLEIADSEDGNLSFALEENGRLVGYLLGWLSDTQIAGRLEQVALIDDLVVVPTARQHLKRLISSFVDELQVKDKGHLAVEAAIVAEALPVFTQHSRFLENLGYEVVCEVPYDDDKLETELTFVRYHPWGGHGEEALADTDILETEQAELGLDQEEPDVLSVETNFTEDSDDIEEELDDEEFLDEE